MSIQVSLSWHSVHLNYINLEENNNFHYIMLTLISIALSALSLLAVSANGPNVIDKLNKVKDFDEKNWFLENIPFIELPDKNIEDVYYYRWSSHKRHLRYLLVGTGYVVTEFVLDVGWQNKLAFLNDAAGHQIYESRWLRDQRYVKVNQRCKMYTDQTWRRGYSQNTPPKKFFFEKYPLASRPADPPIFRVFWKIFGVFSRIFGDFRVFSGLIMIKNRI